MTFDYADRRGRLRDVMSARGVDAVVLSVGPDLPYFTGYEAMPSERFTALLLTHTESVLMVPELEAPRVGDVGVEVRPWPETSDPIGFASSLLRNKARVGVGDHMWSVFLTRFIEALPHAQWVPASELTGSLRIQKSAAEIEFLTSAAHAVDRVMARIPDQVRFSGASELDVAKDLAELTVEEGHDEAAFTIVASGPNGASPHHAPGARLIQPGDLVVCDFGGRLGGYFSDSTRTFAVGEPSARQIEVHAVVLEANEAARAVVAPGVTCAQVDAAARSIVADAGYGDYFIHRTGHGIGLEVHEGPYIVEGNDTPLEPGMAFSIEPGIYLPDESGVRIEDIVVCTGEGANTLNRSNRELIAVD